MTAAQLREEINTELELLESDLSELLSLQQDLLNKQPTKRELAAAAIFMAQFYNGIENIFKRICYFHGVPLPSGDNWHVELFKRFCTPVYATLPPLLDAKLAEELKPFRNFRHVVFHGYVLQLEWSRMQIGVESIHAVFGKFKIALHLYLQNQ